MVKELSLRFQQFLCAFTMLLFEYSKFKVDFKNAEKTSPKVFCFQDNCISIGCVKSSLSRREYLLSTLSALRNNLEILLVTSKDFLQVNCLHSYQ